MNIVDTANGRKDVTDQTQYRADGVPRRAKNLVVGDVIPVNFTGYGELYCQITSITHEADGRVTVAASDQDYTYSEVYEAQNIVKVYPAELGGTVVRR